MKHTLYKILWQSCTLHPLICFKNRGHIGYTRNGKSFQGHQFWGSQKRWKSTSRSEIHDQLNFSVENFETLECRDQELVQWYANTLKTPTLQEPMSGTTLIHQRHCLDTNRQQLQASTYFIYLGRFSSLKTTSSLSKMLQNVFALADAAFSYSKILKCDFWRTFVSYLHSMKWPPPSIWLGSFLFHTPPRTVVDVIILFWRKFRKSRFPPKLKQQ